MPRPTIIENTKGEAQKGYIYGCGLGYGFGQAPGNSDGVIYCYAEGKANGYRYPTMKLGIVVNLGVGDADGKGDGDGEGAGDGYADGHAYHPE